MIHYGFSRLYSSTKGDMSKLPPSYKKPEEIEIPLDKVSIQFSRSSGTLISINETLNYLFFVMLKDLEVKMLIN